MKNKVATLALAGVLALGAVGCGQQAQPEAKTETKVEQNETKNETKVEQTEVKTNWTDAKDAEEAAKGAKIDKFAAFASIKVNDFEYKDPKFAYADGVAQAKYEGGATELVLREGGNGHKAPLTDRDKTEFANKWTESIENVNVTLYGAEEGKATVITWSDNSLDFGVTFQGLGGEEVSLTKDEVTAIVKAVKEAASSTQQSSENSNQQSNNQQQNNNGQQQSSSNGGGTVLDVVDGFEVRYTKDQCMMIAAQYAGAGGQAKGEAQNLMAGDLITGGGTVYYEVDFDLGDVHYTVQVDAVQGDVISASQMFNGVEQVLDRETAEPVEGTEQPVDTHGDGEGEGDYDYYAENGYDDENE